MAPLGIIECFYGRPWARDDREAYAHFLAKNHFQFYIYGPKADENLRRNWRQGFSSELIQKYSRTRNVFRDAGLKFGIILSPQGLNDGFDLASRRALDDRIKELNDIGLDMLGLFFDDMKSAPDLARRQLEIVEAARNSAGAKLIFCPSYYSHDSLLEFMFGDRPANYLETLGRELSPDVEIVWTGEQIISPEISGAHLKSIAEILRRKPFICDNFFADDGPINCNFLRLLPAQGRAPGAFLESSAWAVNPMNQSALSKIVLQAFSAHVHDGGDSRVHFETAVREHCARGAADFILSNHQRFAQEGLIELSEEEKAKWRRRLSEGSGGSVQKELLQWLDGYYAQALEVVLDQNGFGEP